MIENYGTHVNQNYAVNDFHIEFVFIVTMQTIFDLIFLYTFSVVKTIIDIKKLNLFWFCCTPTSINFNFQSPATTTSLSISILCQPI